MQTAPAPRIRLIEDYLPLVRAVARRYAGAGEPLEDLVQVGSIGLIKAVDRFDARHGAELAPYAAASIAGEIRHHLRDRSAPVRVPRRLRAEGLTIRAVALDDGASPGRDGAPEWQDRIALAAALHALRPRERRIVQLRFFGDLSQAQIAAELGLSQVHVSRLLRHALAALRDELADPPADVASAVRHA